LFEAVAAAYIDEQRLSASGGSGPGMSENNKEHRLPPPAFPPGHRRRVHTGPTVSRGVPKTTPDDGTISPDDPIPLRRDPMEQAFISPDDPMPARRLDLAPAFADYARPTAADGEGEAVGMDMETHADHGERVTGSDRHLNEIVVAVTQLAESLRRRGEASLRAAPGLSRLDATLRAYCAGYLAGRRAEEPPPPVDPEY
jgi:hypothetical protein